MTNQHRATPEQWRSTESTAQRSTPMIPWSTADCLLELRARVEALEKAQHPASRLGDEEVLGTIAMIKAAPADSLVERVALTRMNPPLDESDLRDARAAIREVAAWLKNERQSPLVADVLVQESNR